MLYSISHTTNYLYTDPVSLCHNLVHLRPRSHARQVCHHSTLTVLPDPRVMQNQVDYFGNPVTLFTIKEVHRRLSISAMHRVEVMQPESPRFDQSLPWEEVRGMMKAPGSAAILEAVPFVFDSTYIQQSAELADYAAPSFGRGTHILEAARNLTHRIHRDFRYDPKATSLATPLADVLKYRHGVCQDFAHLQIGCLRSLGLPARYVSGYLQTNPPPGRERLVGTDASHAWLSVYCPSVGWVDFDPTNDIIPAEQHITIAWGRDYDDISPVKGIILGAGTHTMSISVDVTAIS